MKPIRLMMRAFGPYKDEQVIDFRDLGEHRLFAISGKTGAGKTTIFDGIAFALYGNGSGADREDTKNLRSQFADEKVHTAVELTFESKQQLYRIFRQLPHKKKGNKSETGDKITFFEIDSEGNEIPACKPKLSDVRLKIEEILGLSYDQFNQIVMLPQGEFRKLLTSDTKNKEKILRKVFKTERYDQIAQKLEDKKRAAEDEAKLARKMRDEYINQIAGAIPARESLLFARLAEHSNIFQILDALAEEQQFYEQKMVQDDIAYQAMQKLYQTKYEDSVAAKQQNEQLASLTQKREQLVLLEAEKPAFEVIQKEYEQAVRASKITPIYQIAVEIKSELETTATSQQQTAQQLQDAERSLQAIKQEYERQVEQEPVRIKLANEMNELEKIKPLYEEMEQLQKQLPMLEQAVGQADTHVQHYIGQGESLKAQQEQRHTQIEQIEEQVTALPDVLQHLQQLKETTQIFAQLDEVERKVNASQLKCQQTEVLVAQQKDIFEQEQQKWISHRAYELASQLVPGEACPVCGSLEHPNVQQAANQADKRTLEQAQQALETARQAQATAIAQHETITQQQDQLLEHLQARDILVQERGQYEQHYVDTQQQVTDLTKQSTQLKQLKQLQNDLRQQREYNEQQLQAARVASEQAKQQYLQKRTILDSKQQTIPTNLQSLAEVNTLLAQKCEQYEQAKRVFQQVEQQYNDMQLQVAKLGQTLAHLTSHYEQLTVKFATIKQQYEAAMAQYGFDSLEIFLQARRSEQLTEQLNSRYQQFSQQLQTLQRVIEEQEVQLAGKVIIDLTNLQEELSTLQQQVDFALLELNNTKGYANSCHDYKDKLQQAAGEIDRLEKYSGEIVQLYKVLVGQNDEFISFERFIQIGYLEQITEAANLRLHRLSNGQFSLSCSDRKEGNRRQSGLSLDVYDSYTGLPRDVKSLSGGEKFNASLCLALGLADVIQSFQGNVRIDTMFIDEGFGSLDEESLMRAIDVLIELQKSGRIVGVISHVEELKEAMPAIIQIEKLKAGYSQAKIIVK